MADLTVAKGDYGYNLAFSIVNSSGTAYTLTGYTITLKVWKDTKSHVLLVNDTCNIVSAALGTCTYPVLINDFNNVGVYNMELELTQAGIVESTQRYKIEVVDSG